MTTNTTSSTFATIVGGVGSDFVHSAASLYMLVTRHWGRRHSLLPAWAEVLSISVLMVIIAGKQRIMETYTGLLMAISTPIST